MRDTSDMMEDTLSEDTMMDCGGDGGGGGGGGGGGSGSGRGGLQDFVDLASNVADSSPTIRDAAERLLTLLGVDEENDDFLSSSEDEGVELDVEDIEEDDEREENSRFIHQLAASLAQEFTRSQQKQSPNPAKGRASTFTDQSERMETVQDTSYLEHSCLQEQNYGGSMGHYRENIFADENETKLSFGNFSQDTQDSSISLEKEFADFESSDVSCLGHHRLRMEELEEMRDGSSSSEQERVLASWAAGWDACAMEALRYLVEDEGLPPHHPTVIAMRDHLDMQRGRAFARYAT